MKGDEIEVMMERGNLVLASLVTRVEMVPESGCWIWMGACRDGGSGYGRVWINGVDYYALRAVYEFMIGAIPDGLTIDHLCKVRCCVNPSHMEIVTRAENSIRGDGPPALNKRKTHCKNGHLFTDENTDIKSTKSGVSVGRRCRACHIEYMRTWNSGPDGDEPYTSHFSTCPEATQWRQS